MANKILNEKLLIACQRNDLREAKEQIAQGADAGYLHSPQENKL